MVTTKMVAMAGVAMAVATMIATNLGTGQTLGDSQRDCQ